MTMITPSSKLTLTKGNKSWSSTAVAAALELVDPPGCRNSISSRSCLLAVGNRVFCSVGEGLGAGLYRWKLRS